ncbi:signal peptide peptidase SppA [Myxococcaceae bacterium GXIMD 01537]
MRALLFLLLPSLALGQTGVILEPAVPPRGVTLPPTSLALVDEATALSVNPAALRFVGPAQLFYVHERNLARDQVGDGVFLGATPLGLGLGVALQWIRGHGQPDYRKTSWGLSLGSRTLALGGTYNTYGSDDEDIDELSSFDLGLAWRPARAFAFGALVSNIDAPQEGPLKLRREYTLGVGLRPLGERYSLGVDYLFRDGDGFDAGRFTYTLQAEIIPGVRASAGVSHVVAGPSEVALQAALTVDLSHFGLTYAAGGGDGGMDNVLMVRLSQEPYRSLRPSGGIVTLVDLNDALSGGSSPALSLLGVTESDPYLRTLRFLQLAAEDKRLRGVVLKLEGLPGAEWGRAEELRQAVLALRKAGKQVLAVLFNCDDTCYLVASAADRVYALQESMLPINGLAAHVTSIGGTMEKLGVTWDVARVGAYKTAPEQLTRTEMSPAQRETVDAYLDNEVAWYEAAVVAGRKVPVERLREAWSDGLVTARRAQALGLVDRVVSPAELDKEVDKWLPGASYRPDYSPRDERDTQWGRPRKLAIVPVLGTIAGGRSRRSPLGGDAIAGAETVVRALQRAQDDPNVVAIVVRVDSGGGDVLASDLMYRAVLEARKKKPVVASMGDVAASGGYYAAMGAEEIFALPTTLTGSIGVFYLKPAVEQLGRKLGVNREALTRAPLADMFDIWAPWTPAQQKAAQAWVDDSYDNFITEVAASRKLDKQTVDGLARGRVWAGKPAQERKLVDQLGGLVEALAAARKRAGVSPTEELDVAVYGEPAGFFSSFDGEPGVLARLLPEALGAPPPPVLPEGVRALAAEAGLTAPELLEPGMKAQLPFSLSVR